MAQKIFRTGNSLAVTIPAEFVQDMGIKRGDSVKVKVDKEKGKMILEFSGAQQLSFIKARRSKK